MQTLEKGEDAVVENRRDADAAILDVKLPK